MAQDVKKALKEPLEDEIYDLISKLSLYHEAGHIE